MERILAKYSQIKDKKGLCLDLSRDVKVNWATIYNHWLGKGGRVPFEHQDRFIKELDRVLRMQNLEIIEAIEL